MDARKRQLRVEAPRALHRLELRTRGVGGSDQSSTEYGRTGKNFRTIVGLEFSERPRHPEGCACGKLWCQSDFAKTKSATCSASAERGCLLSNHHEDRGVRADAVIRTRARALQVVDAVRDDGAATTTSTHAQTPAQSGSPAARRYWNAMTAAITIPMLSRSRAAPTLGSAAMARTSLASRARLPSTWL